MPAAAAAAVGARGVLSDRRDGCDRAVELCASACPPRSLPPSQQLSYGILLLSLRADRPPLPTRLHPPAAGDEKSRTFCLTKPRATGNEKSDLCLAKPRATTRTRSTRL